MIIDAHVHIGDSLGLSFPPELVLKSMEKYNIDYALVSNLDGSEVDYEQNLIPDEYRQNQIEINKKMIDFARKCPDKIGALLWGMPLMECCDEAFEKLVADNLDVVHGIKIHPYHNKTRFDDPKVQEYIKLAGKYDLAVMTHTAMDKYSDCRQVYEMAKKYPKIRFVMAHAQLGSEDNSQAIECLKEGLPNLYADCAWVRPQYALQIIKECGADKLLFGSDNPIDGLDTYAHPEFYGIYFNEFKNMVTEEEYTKLMKDNSVKVYKLNLQ